MFRILTVKWVIEFIASRHWCSEKLSFVSDIIIVEINMKNVIETISDSECPSALEANWKRGGGTIVENPRSVALLSKGKFQKKISKNPPEPPGSKTMCTGICNLYWDANPIIVDIETDANIPSVQISCRDAPQQKLSMISKNSCSYYLLFQETRHKIRRHKCLSQD